MSKKRKKHLVARELERIFLFKGIEPNKILSLLRDCPVVCLEQGEVVISQGQVNHSCYFILSGSLRIHLDTVDSPPLSVLYPGESVGEISLLDGELASAHVICHEACELLVLPDETFWSLISASHDFSRNLLFLTIRRLRNSNVSMSASFKKQREFQLTATIDDLTGLYNRRWLKKMLDRQMRRSQYSKDPLSILVIDVDHFKKFNDNHGHLAGDHVLRLVAQTMINSVRPTDLVTRYGGEEFIIILPNTERAGARVVAERFCHEMSAMTITTKEDLALPKVTVSVGVAQMREGEEMEDLIRRADQALYQAKENGRNRVEG